MSFFTLDSHYKYIQTNATQSNYWQDFFLCNGGQLEEAEDFKSVIVACCVVESK